MSLTITGLEERIYKQNDVGIAIKINEVIGTMKNEQLVGAATEVTLELLGIMKQRLHESGNKKGSVDLLLPEMLSGSSNTIEASLTYLEELQLKLEMN